MATLQVETLPLWLDGGAQNSALCPPTRVAEEVGCWVGSIASLATWQLFGGDVGAARLALH